MAVNYEKMSSEELNTRGAEIDKQLKTATSLSEKTDLIVEKNEIENVLFDRMMGIKSEPKKSEEIPSKPKPKPTPKPRPKKPTSKKVVKSTPQVSRTKSSDTKRLQVRISADDFEKVKKLAELAGCASVSDFVRYLVNNFIKSHRLVTEYGYIAGIR